MKSAIGMRSCLSGFRSVFLHHAKTIVRRHAQVSLDAGKATKSGAIASVTSSLPGMVNIVMVTCLLAASTKDGPRQAFAHRPPPCTRRATAASELPDTPYKARYEDPDRRATLPTAHHAPAGFGQHRQTGNPRRSRRSVDRGDRGRRGQ